MNALKSASDCLRRGLSIVFNWMTATLLIICFSATGCFLAKLKNQVHEYLTSTVLVGQISTAFKGEGPIIVAAYTINQGKREVVHYTVLHDFGEYELMVAKGNYYVFAYWDKNSNLIYDAGEPAGQYGDPKMVSAPGGGAIGDINIAIPEKAQHIDVPSGFEISLVKPHKLYSRLAGAIINLDDELFSEEHGSIGYREPVSFFKELGGNIFFLEEYDPKKIPILFIHGAAGTPKGWKYFADNIDRTRFQPWFFYYPSGSRIQGMSDLLFWKLHNLKAKYHFDQLYITAHSMGGLVARSFIMDYGAHFPCVKLFISLATPWGGVKLAEQGVKQSPAAIPCWIDIQPGSAFIQSLYRTKMPVTISFYMFSGHRGSRNPFRSNNDGTIALSSLMDSRPQAEAKMNYSFNEDHAGIIYSKEVLDQYNEIINTFSHRSGGYLKIRFSYNDPFEGQRREPTLTLVLQPIGKKRAETAIRLSAKNNGRILGPFPIGDYLAFFGALTAIHRNCVPVTIKNNETCELKFVLTPDNVIYGRVITGQKMKDWAAGMPYEENIAMQSITLNGTGIHRNLHLLEGEDVNIWDYHLPRTDFYYKGEFFIFGLPTGEFELIIRAQGYKPFVKKCFVKADKQFYPMYVELTPE